MKRSRLVPVFFIIILVGITFYPMAASVLPQVWLQQQSEVVRVAEYTMKTMDFSFGTWGRGIMMQGLLDASNVTGNVQYEQFVQFWTIQSILTQTLDGVLGHGDLTLGDATALARPVLYFYQKTGSSFYLVAALRHLEFLRACPLRFHDSYRGISHTYNRLELWVDQMYMVNIFMTEIGVLLNDEAVVNESIDQTRSHVAFLQDPETGLFRHIIREISPGHYEWRDANFWGRGNGWAMACLVDQMEMIEGMPSQASNFQFLNSTLNKLVANLTPLQDSSSGLWHTLLTDDDSYLETSCSALFAYAIGKAVNHSWIAPDNATVAINAFKGILNRVSPNGVLTWVSGGTGEHPETVPRFNTAISWGQGIFLKCYRFFSNYQWEW
ncbi:MAG: glycoside hydrolase family 88 protein [Candidatus Helarchaeales archaeon]